MEGIDGKEAVMQMRHTSAHRLGEVLARRRCPLLLRDGIRKKSLDMKRPM